MIRRKTASMIILKIDHLHLRSCCTYAITGNSIRFDSIRLITALMYRTFFADRTFNQFDCTWQYNVHCAMSLIYAILTLTQYIWNESFAFCFPSNGVQYVFLSCIVFLLSENEYAYHRFVQFGMINFGIKRKFMCKCISSPWFCVWMCFCAFFINIFYAIQPSLICIFRSFSEQNRLIGGLCMGHR